MSPSVSLLIRLPMERDEWPETYLARLARANGLRHPCQEDLDRIRPNLISSALAESGRPEYFGSLPTWAVQKTTEQIRYCPACLSEARYIRARWRIKSYEVCILHGINLKTGLTERALQPSSREREIEEITAEEIWSGVTCPMPSERAHASEVWSEIEKAITGSSSNGFTEALAWALLGEHMLNAVLLAWYMPNIPIKREPRLRHRVRWLAKAGKQPPVTERAIREFILSDEMYAELNVRAVFFDRLLRREKSRPSIMSCLLLHQIWEELLKLAPYAAPSAKFYTQKFLARRQKKEDYWCQVQLKGYGYETGKRLSISGFPEKTQKITNDSIPFVFIERIKPAPEAQDQKRNVPSPFLSKEELMKQLCINSFEYARLHGSLLIRPVRLGDSWVYRKRDIDALMAQLRNFAFSRPVSNVNWRPLMGNWLNGKTHLSIVVSQVLNEIWRGQLPAFRQASGEGLKAYYVDDRTIARLQQLTHIYDAECCNETSQNKGSPSIRAYLYGLKQIQKMGPLW